MTYSMINFPKKELVTILELIDDLSRCITGPEAKDLLIRVSGLLKADCALCGTGSIDERGNLRIKNIIESGYPGEWLNLYLRDKLYKYDPVMRHHMKFSAPELWSNIKKNSTDDKELAVAEWAGEYGLKYGISSSLYLPATESFSLFCFASAEDVFTKQQQKTLNALILHLNMAITESSTEVNSFPLSERRPTKALIQ